MKKIVFATNNPHKLSEIREIIGNRFQILSLKDIECFDDIPETADTLKGNALLKARYVHQRYNYDVFSDDTGLLIDALNGEPGVYSARYAGPNCSFEDNMQKVLNEMDGKENRKACFKTVIALILDGKEYCFEGQVDGEIIPDVRGNEGFGYDPIFVPTGYQETFAQMSSDEKNKISHRGRATARLVDFLNKL
ncbi:MAG: non-canonical purine NTP diphosphatase [Bacteroidales bacterium]